MASPKLEGEVPNESLMAGVDTALAREKDTSYWRTLLENKKCLGYVILTAVAPMMFGFDNIIVGVVSAMPAFQMSFGEQYGESFILPAMWLSLWNALVNLGIMIGAVANGFVISRFGRRGGFILGGAIATASIGCLFASSEVDTINGKRGVFLLGKTVLGFSFGILLSTSQTYVSEVAPTKLRGPFLAAYTLFMAIGQLIAISLIFNRILIFDNSAYRVPFAGQWAFSLLAILSGFIIPESPLYYLRNNQTEKAKKAYRRLHSTHNDAAGFALLQATLLHEQQLEQKASNQATILDCFKGTDARRTRIIIWANVLQQLLGISLIANSTYFLQLAGMSAKLSLLITQIGISLILIANVISWYTMTRFGRRMIMLVGTVVVALLWLSIGIAGCFHGSVALWYIGVTLNVVTFCILSGVGSAWPVVSAETSSIRLRPLSQTVAWATNAFASWLFTFVVPYLFNTDEANLGGKIGFIFAGLCAIGFVIIWFEIPEMKGRSYIALDELFNKRVPTRKFPGFNCHEEAALVDTIVDTTKSNFEHHELTPRASSAAK